MKVQSLANMTVGSVREDSDDEFQRVDIPRVEPAEDTDPDLEERQRQPNAHSLLKFLRKQKKLAARGGGSHSRKSKAFAAYERVSDFESQQDALGSGIEKSA